jgi:NADH:ubiquinone oxidoreductase subunit H
MVKIFTKEDWIPPFADRAVFVIAPAIIIVTVLLAFAVIPFSPGIMVVNLNVGLLYFLAFSSLGAYSVALAGWSSGSKYALLGALRGVAQMLGYEVFMGLSLMGVVMLAGSFDLSAVVAAPRRGSRASSSSSSPGSRRRGGCLSTCPRRRASLSPATTRNIPPSSSACSSWASTWASS